MKTVVQKMSDIFEYSSETKSSEITDEVNIYPNPNSGSFTVEILNDYEDEISYTIFDLSGKKIYENKIYKSDCQITEKIELHNLPKDIYIIQFYFKNDIINKKELIIQ